MSRVQTDLFPQHLLFEGQHELKQGRGAYFKNQTDLAYQIADLPGHYRGKGDTVRALLNQALRPGVSRNSRALPVKLKEALFSAVEHRAAKGFDRKSFEKRFEEALKNLKSQGRYGDAIASGILEKEFLEVSRQAEKHWIITRKPAEIAENEFGDRLTRLMIENVHAEHKYYHFYFHSDYIAIRFWAAVRRAFRRQLFDGTATSGTHGGNISEKKLNEHITVLNVKKQRLQVFVNRNMELFLHPYVIFDYDKDSIKGYVLHYHGEAGISHSRMTKEDLDFWLDQQFNRLINRDDVVEFDYTRFLKFDTSRTVDNNRRS